MWLAARLFSSWEEASIGHVLRYRGPGLASLDHCPTMARPLRRPERPPVPSLQQLFVHKVSRFKETSFQLTIQVCRHKPF